MVDTIIGLIWLTIVAIVVLAHLYWLVFALPNYLDKKRYHYKLMKESGIKPQSFWEKEDFWDSNLWTLLGIVAINISFLGIGFFIVPIFF